MQASQKASNGIPFHRHLTSAPLSRNITILQEGEFKAKLLTKENNAKTKTQIIYSVRRHAHTEIEPILYGRAEHGQRLKDAEK